MGLYCKKNAEDGMVNARNKRCEHALCTRQPSFNLEGRTRAAYCKGHAEDGMINVIVNRCSLDSCSAGARWGRLGEGVATACARHKSEILVGPVISFRARCKTLGCKKYSR